MSLDTLPMIIETKDEKAAETRVHYYRESENSRCMIWTGSTIDPTPFQVDYYYYYYYYYYSICMSPVTGISSWYFS